MRRGGATRALGAEPIFTDDGLYKQPWFLESFLDLPDDLESAAKEGKRFDVMWELKGCPYCKETHFVNFGQTRISDYIKANFEICNSTLSGRARSPISTDRYSPRRNWRRNMLCVSPPHCNFSRKRPAR